MVAAYLTKPVRARGLFNCRAALATRRHTCAVSPWWPGRSGPPARRVSRVERGLHIDSLATLALDLETRAAAGADDNWQECVAKIVAEFDRIAGQLRAQLEPESRSARG